MSKNRRSRRNPNGLTNPPTEPLAAFNRAGNLANLITRLDDRVVETLAVSLSVIVLQLGDDSTAK